MSNQREDLRPPKGQFKRDFTFSAATKKEKKGLPIVLSFLGDHQLDHGNQ